MIPRRALNELHAAVKAAEGDRAAAETAYESGKVETGDSCLRAAEIGFLNVIARSLVVLVSERTEC